MNIRIAALSLLCCLLLAAGCGVDRPQTVSVSGNVTFAGEAPPVAGTVFFAALEPAPGFPRRSAQGHFAADGSYQATSFEEGDGLLPGKYRVRIECWQTMPTMDVPGVSHIPAGASIPDLEVSADGGAVTLDIDVPGAAS